MLGSRKILIAILASLVLGACASIGAANGKSADTQRGGGVVEFKEARLIVETNATDGDAGLQIFLDHEPWSEVALYRPDGGKILDVITQGVLKDYGLTELFSESSEPPFKKFPLEEFKKLFPEGEYRLAGTTIEGKQIESMVTLTHDFPAGPEILTPAEDSEVPAGDVVVSWKPVTEPAGIEIIGYQVLVVNEDAQRTFSADLPATATEITVPSQFLESGVEYKVEVLAIEANRNQTLTEITFTVA